MDFNQSISLTKRIEVNKNKLWEHLEFMYLYTYSYKSNIDELNSGENGCDMCSG